MAAKTCRNSSYGLRPVIASPSPEAASAAATRRRKLSGAGCTRSLTLSVRTSRAMRSR